MSTQKFELGDFVSIEFAHATAIGVVINLHTSRNQLSRISVTPAVRERVIADPTPKVIAVRLGQYHSDVVLAEQCRKLTGKEVFKAKLSDDWDYYLKYDKVDLS